MSFRPIFLILMSLEMLSCQSFGEPVEDTEAPAIDVVEQSESEPGDTQSEQPPDPSPIPYLDGNACVADAGPVQAAARDMFECALKTLCSMDIFTGLGQFVCKELVGTMVGLIEAGDLAELFSVATDTGCKEGKKKAIKKAIEKIAKKLLDRALTNKAMADKIAKAGFTVAVFKESIGKALSTVLTVGECIFKMAKALWGLGCNMLRCVAEWEDVITQTTGGQVTGCTYNIRKCLSNPNNDYDIFWGYKDCIGCCGPKVPSSSNDPGRCDRAMQRCIWQNNCVNNCAIEYLDQIPTSDEFRSLKCDPLTYVGPPEPNNCVCDIECHFIHEGGKKNVLKGLTMEFRYKNRSFCPESGLNIIWGADKLCKEHYVGSKPLQIHGYGKCKWIGP